MVKNTMMTLVMLLINPEELSQTISEQPGLFRKKNEFQMLLLPFIFRLVLQIPMIKRKGLLEKIDLIGLLKRLMGDGVPENYMTRLSQKRKHYPPKLNNVIIVGKLMEKSQNMLCIN